MKRSIFLTSFFDTQSSVEPLHLAGDAAGVVGGVEAGDRTDAASPWSSACQFSRLPIPRGKPCPPGDDDAPIHIASPSVLRLRRGLDVLDGVADRVNLSASSSLISILNASSSAMTSSTVSSESAPRSFTKEASMVTSPDRRPSCSTIIPFTLSSSSRHLIPPCGPARYPRQCPMRPRAPVSAGRHADYCSPTPTVKTR